MKEISGFLLIDKPKGMTSHDVVDFLRKITKIKRIGHAGTLDPLATGLLIVGISRAATKKLSLFQKMEKEYEAKIRLGAVSDTFDAEGKITLFNVKEIPKRETIERVLKNFLGKIKQIPPPFSAKKIGGKKAYELARKGIFPKLKEIELEIYEIELVKYEWPILEIRIRCSSGTYVRTLAHEIGQKLGTGGYVEELRRTKIGEFSVEKAKKLSEISPENWRKFLLKLIKGEGRI